MTAEQARAIALALPGMVEQPHHELASFRVKAGIVATLTPDGAELRVFLKDDDARDAWLRREPGAVQPQFWGAKRVGLAVSLAAVESGWLGELLQQAWRERVSPAKTAGRRV